MFSIKGLSHNFLDRIWAILCMQNKFTEFSLCGKKYVLALVIVTMVTLQNTLPILNLKTLFAKNIRWNWGVGAGHSLYGVLFKDLQGP